MTLKLLFQQLTLLILLYFTVHNSHAQQAGKTLFNDNWEFQLINSEYEQVSITDKGWKKISLPHDWSIEGPFSSEWASGTGFLPGGIGWYRKNFKVESKEGFLRHSIYFDGIFKNSEVWINGHYLGKRPNGFIPIFYDLTPYLKAENNTMLVKVDHQKFADSRYYTGSGIYRNVYLIESNPIHFAQWGVFFSTPKIEKSQALAQAEVDVEQHLQTTKNITVNGIIKNSEGKKVAENSQVIQGKKGAGNQSTLDFTIKNPHLWSVDDPYLYTLVVELWADDQLMDQWVDQVGIRDFNFDADKGFFLNGEPTLIKGVCLHHDAGALGAAVPKEVWRNRLETLKELGSNAIRMSHYPHQDYIYELCDEMGFLVQDEAFDEWEIPKNKWIEGWNVGTPGNDSNQDDFQKWAERDVADMVKRNRNRPSIIMWSIGNEIDYPNDPYSHPVLDEGRNPQIYGKGYVEDNPPASSLAGIAKSLVDAVKKVDATRPVTAALAGVTMSNETDYPENLDIVGYNYQEYRYQEDHKKYPDRVIYGSENGDALEAWLAVVENEFISAQFLWTAFDFIGEARAWPQRSSGAGIIDLAGYPKPDYYFRQSLWNEKPMVYLGIAENEIQVLRRSNISNSWTDETGDKPWITCYTNTDEVELFINGRSLGKKPGLYQKEQMIAWQLDFEPGELKVVAYNDGKKVANYTLNTPGTISKIDGRLSKQVFSKENEVIELDLQLIDAQGNLVEVSDEELTLDLDGPVQILGLESGDLASHESYQAASRKTYKGKLKAYLQTNGVSKSIQIRVSSPSLPEAVFKIELE
jgi:beta-galactosidase/beta-glucuronidase